eukprot:445889-Pleurochrysis_carterae.AAC.1
MVSFAFARIRGLQSAPECNLMISLEPTFVSTAAVPMADIDFFLVPIGRKFTLAQYIAAHDS